VGSRSSPHSIASAISKAGSSQTTDQRRSEALFQAAVKNFELGARAFQKQNYERAKEIFEKLASTGVAGVAERARVHLRLCEQKLSRPGPPPRKPEDLYTLGVGALNSRRLDDAIEYLNKAQKSAPKLEHIGYALAAAYSLRGDAEAALQHLREAIILRPQNRIQARRDEDFQALATDARFKELVFNSNP
jgi:tetratricopeptide (TPR) repeat protein